jgi:hypothetical protein
VARLEAPGCFLCCWSLSLAGGDGREWRAHVDVPIRPGGGSLMQRWGIGCGGSCRCPNPTGQSLAEARVDVPIQSGGRLVSMSQSDRPTLSESRLMSQSDRPTLCESRLMSQSNRLLFSCRCTSCSCSVLGPDLPINMVNSLLLINERRTVRFRIFRGKKLLFPYSFYSIACHFCRLQAAVY